MQLPNEEEIARRAALELKKKQVEEDIKQYLQKRDETFRQWTVGFWFLCVLGLILMYIYWMRNN